MLTTVAEIVQIAFWLVVGAIGVLTYRQARKTVLQPLRTEVFKLQLERMSEVLAIFVGRDEMKLLEDSHILQMYRANAALLMDHYGEMFFPINIDKSKRPYANITRFRADPHIVSEVNEHIDTSRKPGEPLEKAQRDQIREEWPAHQASMIGIPPGHVEYRERITGILEDPLLPTACAALLEDYLDALDRSVDSIVKLIEWGAPKMPNLYLSVEDLRASSDSWLYNHWIETSVPLTPHAEQIVKFARHYFNSDEFAPRNGSRVRPLERIRPQRMP